MATKTVQRQPYEAILPTNPANSQKGKIIIITGGNSGIGAAVARVWAEAGAEGIVITARRAAELHEVADGIASKHPETKILAIPGDIISNEDTKNLYATVQKTFGRSADVLMNNAAVIGDDMMIGDTSTDDWWKGFEINFKGAYNMTHHFIQSQPNPKEPQGTIINISSGRAGLFFPGGSSYDIAKLAEQKLSEHIQMEYPTLRVFTSMPGLVETPKVPDYWKPYAKDHADLTGMQALYLVQPRADFLKGCMVGVNWDVEELEQHKEEIVEKKVLRLSWMPILPVNGGKGLGVGA